MQYRNLKKDIKNIEWTKPFNNYVIILHFKIFLHLCLLQFNRQTCRQNIHRIDVNLSDNTRTDRLKDILNYREVLLTKKSKQPGESEQKKSMEKILLKQKKRDYIISYPLTKANKVHKDHRSSAFYKLKKNHNDTGQFYSCNYQKERRNRSTNNGDMAQFHPHLEIFHKTIRNGVFVKYQVTKPYRTSKSLRKQRRYCRKG